uniref:Uncharacterized protein n=1 Tax=viral metagenome TaxID=1070528 RepID=A0A6M3KHY1_9ZZZZ
MATDGKRAVKGKGTMAQQKKVDKLMKEGFTAKQAHVKASQPAKKSPQSMAIAQSRKPAKGYKHKAY